MFHCIHCAHECFLDPGTPGGCLKEAVLSESYLREYQRNFRMLVFDQAKANTRFCGDRRIQYREWTVSPKAGEWYFLVASKPMWLLDDESPAKVGDRDLYFLFQTLLDMEYPRQPGAPDQTLFDSVFHPSQLDHYSLFNYDELYFFGPITGEPDVCIVTRD